MSVCCPLMCTSDPDFVECRTERAALEASREPKAVLTRVVEEIARDWEITGVDVRREVQLPWSNVNHYIGHTGSDVTITVHLGKPLTANVLQ